MNFQCEPWSHIEREIRGLVDRHWEELALFKGQIKLDVNWDHYRNLAERDYYPLLQVTTARTADQQLAGYWINILNFHPHYRRTVFAFQDSYFLLPEYRKANTGLGLLHEMERNARLGGAQAIIASDKQHLSMEPMFMFHHFVRPGNQYMRYIGGD